ncbi:hypothetical protein A2U01_0016326, partial [Trifolium medium]|nr:hypothetical protein [Trifolium medium]
MCWPNVLMSAIEILEFVKAANCYPIGLRLHRGRQDWDEKEKG